MAATNGRPGAASWTLVAAMIAALVAVAAFAAPALANPNPDPERPDISLSATALVDRPFTWTIEKTADVSELTLQPGQTATVNYTVTADTVEGPTGWSVSGEVTVFNNESTPVLVSSVGVDISGVGPANVTCLPLTQTLPRNIGAGGQMRCLYHLQLPDNANRVATATAVVGSNTFSTSALVDFANHSVDNRLDHCVEVHDTNVGLLAEQICVNKVNKTETYSIEVGPYEECGEYEVANTAWFVTNQTASTGEDEWSVKVTVPCAQKKCKIGDYVWHDEDKNGKQTTSYAYGINGVVMELLDENGDVVDTTVTSTNPSTKIKGWYLFEVLCKTPYQVRVAEENFEKNGALYGFVATTPNVGSNDALDSDGDILTHTSHVVTVNSGSDLTVDFGFHKSKDDPCGSYDWKGYNKCGYDKYGKDKNGKDKYGRDKDGYKNGYDKWGVCKNGYNRKGYNKSGYSSSGYNKSGYNKTGYDKSGFNKWGKDKYGKYRR